MKTITKRLLLVLTAMALFIATSSILATATAGTLTLSFATNIISEAAGPGATTATVKLDAPFTNNLQLLLRGAVDATKVYLPTPFPITILAGSNSVSFPIDSVNNGDLDGTKSITITIGADNFANTSATLQVTDDDTPTHRTISGRLPGTIAGTNDYYVIDNLTVPSGLALTIQPASHLHFLAGKGLTCNGNLIATSSVGSEIIFTTASSNANWSGISFVNSTPKSLLTCVEISHANGNGLSTTAQTTACPLLLSFSSIHHCQGHGVAITSWDNITIGAAGVQIFTNTIYANGGSGVVLSTLASQCNSSYNLATVTGNEIYNNQNSGVLLDPSVYFNGCNVTCYTEVDGKVDRNFIHGNGGDGITCLADTGSGSGANHVRTVGTLIQNNLILDNGANGIALTGTVQQNLHPTIINNTIVGNGNAGVYHTAAVGNCTLENNLLLQNNYGIQSQTAFKNLNILVQNNDLWGNYISNWMNYPAAYGTLATNNLNGTGCDTNMNLSVDPQVTDFADFHLLATSPVIDAGTTNLAPTNDIVSVNRRGFPDIGAYEFGSLLLTPGVPVNHATFNCQAIGGRGASFTIQSTTDFKSWTSLTNATLSNRSLSLQLPTTNTDHTFYRAQLH